MGLHCDTVRGIFNGVPVAADRRIGEEGQGMAVALSALDSGRLGIAAAAGLAQSALDVASRYATEREQFGRPIAVNQGLASSRTGNGRHLRPRDIPPRRRAARRRPRVL